MSRTSRRIARSFWFGLGISLLWSTAAEAEQRPNILFIAVDDLRPSLGCYGDELAISPHIDSLANRGTRFDRAYCQVAVCNPSRASLMTGQRPDDLGVWTLPIHFREARPLAVTLPQWLRRFGYTAVSHGKIYHNPTPDPQSWSEPIRPLPQLPDAYPDGTRGRIRAAQLELPRNDWRKNNLRGPGTGISQLDEQQLVDGARTEMAIEDLKRLGKSGQPFFLAMGYIRPHLPWIAPEKFWKLHDPAKLKPIQNAFVTPNTPEYALSNNYELRHYVDLMDIPTPHESREVSEQQARHLLHAYYACVTYVDSLIGQLLKALDDEGLRDNTIVVLWSDHGWKLGEHRGWGKMSNYEIDTRVPLIIAAPGHEPGVVNQPVELLDLFPTLCELAGVERPDFAAGSSLAGLLANPNSAESRVAYSQYYRRLGDDEEYMGYAMRTPTHRFVEWREFATGKPTTLELYDHREEHAETRNIVHDVPSQLVEQLQQQLLESHPRKPLQMTPAVHSNPSPGRQQAPISFRNETDSDLYVYPITTAGRRAGRRV
ncbi:MAG: sulfatase, partial [Planctomycetales bacterium]|nr:sulfatase [Planctomycetales bacterium]